MIFEMLIIKSTFTIYPYTKVYEIIFKEYNLSLIFPFLKTNKIINIFIFFKIHSILRIYLFNLFFSLLIIVFHGTIGLIQIYFHSHYI